VEPSGKEVATVKIAQLVVPILMLICLVKEEIAQKKVRQLPESSARRDLQSVSSPIGN
jgi:hypothetical protein